jgi:hypothetical protein
VETNSSHPASDGHFQVHLTMVLAAPKNTKRREGTYDREINGAMCRHGSDFFLVQLDCYDTGMIL